MFGKKVKTVYVVEGMHCGHCAAKVEGAIKALDGVKSVKADPTSGNVEVVSSNELERSLVAEAVKSVGFALAED